MVSAAPKERAKSSFSVVDAVVITRAPHALASWMATVPTPEAPA